MVALATKLVYVVLHLGDNSEAYNTTQWYHSPECISCRESVSTVLLVERQRIALLPAVSKLRHRISLFFAAGACMHACKDALAGQKTPTNT